MARPIPIDSATRSRMRRQRRHDTGPEITVRRALRSLGIAYRVNVKTLPGSPDVANRARGWAILVNGCYWHHHRGCPGASLPKHNREWWKAKFAENAARDARKQAALKKAGLKVLVVWECQTRVATKLRSRLSTWLKQFYSQQWPGIIRDSKLP